MRTTSLQRASRGRGHLNVVLSHHVLSRALCEVRCKRIVRQIHTFWLLILKQEFQFVLKMALTFLVDQEIFLRNLILLTPLKALFLDHYS